MSCPNTLWGLQEGQIRAQPIYRRVKVRSVALGLRLRVASTMTAGQPRLSVGTLSL